MGLYNKVRLLLWLVVIFGAATAYVDYDRLENGKLPVFCQESYNSIQKVETFRGLFYIAERKVRRDPKERLGISSDVHFRFLHKNLTVQVKPIINQRDFVLYVTPSLTCPNLILYHELENKKVYTDCIASIKYKKKDESESKDLNEVLTEESSALDDVIIRASFTGIDNDKTTEKYIMKDTTVTDRVFYIYKCHNGSNRNVYITMNPNKSKYCK